MNLSVFGLGYVGSVTAACLADQGHRVTGVEVNPDKLALFQRGLSPLFEPGLGELLIKVHESGRFTATGSAGEAVRDSDLSFLCVGTPTGRGGQPDLSHLEHVSRELGEALRGKPGTHWVVVRSTVLPGTIEETVVPQIERASGKREGREFHVVANPEFMREGAAIRDFFEPPLVVIGERCQAAGDAVAGLYNCVQAPKWRMPVRAAETVKFACNAFHAMKVTFANEIGQFCQAHDIDGQDIMEIVCQDSRLNISKAYLRPGQAYGGSCLPKDLRALVGRARQRDLELPMLEALARSNLYQIQRMVDRIADLGHREIGLLGLTFKTGTDDLRESPVVIMAESLLGKGFRIAIHDSELELTRLTGANKQFLEEKLPHINSLLVTSLDEVIAASKIIVVCKNHPDYRVLPQRVTAGHRLVDLVGFLKSETFPPGVYHGLYW